MKRDSSFGLERAEAITDAAAGYALRIAYPDRWVRFHSLPASKQYPGDEGEYRIVLDRFDRVAAHLFEASPIFVIATLEDKQGSYKYRKTKKVWKRSVANPLGLAPAFDWDPNYGDDEEGPWMFTAYIGSTVWSLPPFEPTLRLIANEFPCRLVLANRTGSRLLAPYDGGIDCFLADPAELRSIRTTFADWLPFRADAS